MPRILTVAETGSTNADLVALARGGSGEDGLWLRAGQRTGRKGGARSGVESPSGNLYASTLVRLSPAVPPRRRWRWSRRWRWRKSCGRCSAGTRAAPRAEMAQRPAARRRQAVPAFSSNAPMIGW
ncbi:hypothetical protein AB5I41_17830 [Sphingomonas sp. MMS24-JH45]